MIKIILPGEPIAKIRPRVCRKFTYDPQDKLKTAAKFQILHFLKDQRNEHPFPAEMSIEIEINFYMTPRRGEENLPGWGIHENTSKKDIDNLAKFYLDTMNEIVYVDDKQVDSIIAKKFYDTQPRTEIYIIAKKPVIPEKVKEVLCYLSCEEFNSFAIDAQRFSTAYEMDGKIDPAYSAYMICEFAERHAGFLNKIKKKFPGFANILEEEIEKK